MEAAPLVVHLGSVRWAGCVYSGLCIIGKDCSSQAKNANEKRFRSDVEKETNR